MSKSVRPISPEFVTPDVMERFWSKVDRRPGDGSCWLWTASAGRNAGGRAAGVFWYNGGRVSAHRFAFVATTGEDIPSGMVVDHRACESALCVRPDHLRLAVDQWNSRNMRAHTVGSSSFKGVYWHRQRGKWAVGINLPRRRHLGLFVNEIDAAKAYDDVARKHFGEFVALNFPRPGERSALSGEMVNDGE